MKKILSLLLAVFILGSINAQTFQNNTRSAKKTINSTKAINDISGSIASDNFYVPGSTMDLEFTLSFTSSDYEYLDYLELTFPTGFTVNGSSTDPFPNAGGGDPEALNAVTGQTISWGDNDNNWGGTSPGDYAFVVNVTVDAGVTGDQAIDFSVSGDEYAGTIHEFTGTITISAMPTSADLVVTPLGITAEYYAIPLDQANFAPMGNVENVGTELTGAVDLGLTVTGGYTDAQAIPTPLASNANQDLTFATYTATAAGTATFTYTATYAGDANATDNTYSKDIEIGVELSRDNGVANGNIGVGTPDEELGNVFTITTADTLTSVKWVMAGTAGDEVAAIIRNFTTEPTTEVGRSLLVTNDGSAEYEASMVGLVVLQPGTYFIGIVEGANNAGLEYTTTPYIDGTAWAHFSDAWNDLGAMGFEHTYHIRPQFNNVVPTADDVAMVSINTISTVAVGNVDITGTVRNMGNQGSLTSFDVVYTIDGGVATAVYSVTGQNIAPGTTFDFTHNVQYASTVGQHAVEVTLSNPNGNIDENPSDNVMSKNLMVINEIFPKTVVYEEGTGTWCGWCVRGLVGLNTMAHNITDGTWIGIGVHNGDPMAVTEYNNALGAFISGYPSGIMDRHPVDIDPGVSTLEAYYNVRKLEIPVAKIEAASEWNSGTREITVEVTTNFALDMASADYNAAVIVVENEVTGTASGYAQANYYSGGYEMIDWDGTNYTNLPDPVPAADMTYHHVGRALLGGWSGAAGSIPTSVTYGTDYNYTFNHTLPTDQDENNIKLVAIVIDNANGQIINATEIDLAISSGIKQANNSNFNIYPNPTTGLVKVEGVEGSQVVVYNMIGEVVYTEANATATTTIDLSSFNAGNYIIKVINNNEVATQKMVLNK